MNALTPRLTIHYNSCFPNVNNAARRSYIRCCITIHENKIGS